MAIVNTAPITDFDKLTPADGDLFGAEFDALYANDNELQSQIDNEVQDQIDTLTTYLLKQYTGNQTYNTVLLAVTIPSWTVTNSVFLPYKTSNNAWRIRFNIEVTGSSSTDKIVTIAGVSIKVNQAVTVHSNSLATVLALTINTGIQITSGTSLPVYYLSGDVELDSKPTWAD